MAVPKKKIEPKKTSVKAKAPDKEPEPELRDEVPTEAELKADAPMPTAKAANGKVLVTRQFPTGESDEDSETLEVSQFVTTPASVSVHFGATVNLGDYQSAKVGVTVTLPCYIEEIEGAYAVASEFAEEKLELEVESIRNVRDGIDPLDDDDEDEPTPVAAPKKAASAAIEDEDDYEDDDDGFDGPTGASVADSDVSDDDVEDYDDDLDGLPEID